jgi:hypothetical protein
VEGWVAKIDKVWQLGGKNLGSMRDHAVGGQAWGWEVFHFGYRFVPFCNYTLT